MANNLNLFNELILDNANEKDESQSENLFLNLTDDKEEKTKVETKETNVVDSSSDDSSFELPQVTYKDVDLPETKAIEVLKKKLGGLGFTFEETGIFGVDLIPGDYVNITSPPDADGNTVTKRFSFDQWYGKRQSEADGINAFIREHANKNQDVNPTQYAKAWNYVNEKAKTQDLENLSSEELVNFSNNILTELDKSKDITSISQRIEKDMGSFVQQTTIDLTKKHDLNSVEGRNAALEEFNSLINKEFSKRILSDDEYVKLRNSSLNAVKSYFGQDIEKQVRKEGELEVMPSWVNKNPVLNSLVKGVWGTANIKLPKAKYDFTGLNEANKLENVSNEIETYENMDPDEVVFYNKGASVDAKINIPTKKYKASELVDLLKRNKKVFEEKVAYNIVKSDEYQTKLSKIQLPKIFEEDGVGVSGEEFGRIIGDQLVQMVGAAVTLGGSTLIQEGGGAYSEITTAKAAMKMFPGIDKEKAITKFQSLDMNKKTAAIIDLIEKGEGDLNTAYTIGVANAGLDLASNFVIIGKAAKFLPKKLGRDFLDRKYKEFLQGGWKSLGKDVSIGSFSEFLTETTQEGINIFGVGTATGENLTQMATRENLTRIMEAGGQAIIATGPIITTGQVASTVTKEIVDKVASIKNPEHQRNYINQVKKQIDKEFEEKKWTRKERNDIFTALESAEQSFNFKNLDGKAKEQVINKITDIAKNDTKINELQQKIKNQKQESLDVIGEETSNVIDELELKKLKKENIKSKKDIVAEVFTNNYRNNGKDLAKWVNEQKEGLFKDKEVITFKTVKKAEEYINSKNLKFNTEQQKQDFLDGKVNGANLGNIAILVDENINKNTKKGDWSSTNAIHHEVLHFILDSFDTKELETIMNSTINKMKASKDPKMIQMYDLTMQRFNQYKEDPDVDKATEVQEFFTSLSDASKALQLSDLNVENGSVLNDIGESLQKLFTKNTTGSINYSNLNAENTLEFIRKYNDFNGRGPKYKGITIKGGTDVRERVVESKTAPETLIKTIKRGRNAKKVKEAEDALVPQYQALALEALGYTEEKGDILRKNVVSAVNEYYEAIVRNYDPKKGAFSTHVFNNIAPKNDTIFEKAKTLARRESVKLDDPEVKELAGDAGTTTNVEDTFVQKINILKDFAITDRVASKIKSLVKVAQGDTFKQVISKHAGKVGELIFDIPAKKIMKGGANLVPTTKYKEGMPIPSEAQNIQRFFNARENMSKFIKSLPLYNVTDKTADIDKIGENIETPRNVFGIAIGLKGLPLDYFYEDYIDPRSTSKDPKIKAESITSPSGRSKGLTSQTQVKKLKPEFINPTLEVIEKAKRDIGITPKNEPNIYNRDIGQLQKGFAKVYSINASLSGGQRFLADKLAKAPAEKKTDIKKQIASITAAQSKTAFSKSMQESNIVFDNHGLPILDVHDSKNGVKNYNIFLEKMYLLSKYMPKGFIRRVDLFKFITYGSTAYRYAEAQSLELGDTFTIGKQKDRIYLRPEANNALGKNVKDITKAKVKKYNDSGKANFNTMIRGIEKAVKDNPKDKLLQSAIMMYLSSSTNDTSHPLRGGAEYIGGDITATGKIIYEHAVQSARARDIIMDALLDENQNFDETIEALKNNYKLIVMSKKDADQLKASYYIDENGNLISYENGMGVGWDLFNDKFFDRYFNLDVNFINPNNFKLIKNNKTFAKEYGITMSGRSPVIKSNLKGAKVLNNAISSSKFVKESKGITILDFDDTLATTKSLVKYTSPGGVTGTLNAEQFASTYQDLQDQGYTFDFSDFNKVVKGKLAPLFQKALKLQNKFGPENMFVLTARPPASQKAIFDFLKANGLNIPLKNITGLGNSTSEAKALWVADKVAEGYNDFYFADDALQNVQAVKNMLDQFDVKSKVQQAKVKFSKGTLSTKQDLNWKEDNIGYMTTNFDVDGNNYKITLYPTDLNDTNYELEFDLITEYGLTQEMTGTGSQFKVLGIVYNGLLDVIKQKPNIQTIGFSSLTKDKSRARVYTILMDRLGKKLGWKTDIYEYGSGTQLDFEVAKPKTRKAKTKTTESIRNIPAVKNMLNQFDVKAPTQQAKVKFSKSMDSDFNKILQDVTGIEFKKRFSDIKARKRGASKGKFRFFIPPSHEDFVGLLYNFMGKGRKGDQHRDFFEKALVRPLNRAYREIDAAKQAIANDYKSLNKQFPDVKNKLIKNTPDGDFTFQDAIRVYIWDKHGYDIPGLSQTDQKNLVELVNNDANLKSYAETVNLISKQETYVDPGPNWETGNIRIDLIDATGRVGRASYFAEFNENAEIIFSPENLNKIEAAYGKGVREALEDMLHRIKTGVNRPKGASAKPNMLLNWLNASVSGVMFFNTRSALLQQLSNVNFLNFADNNIFAAAKAFANQKQYWKDFAMIFNSDMLKQRRGGIGTDINGAELAEAVKKARPGNLFDQVAIITGKALKLGFLPTQIGDSIAIATGGATFYRNRVNKYIKDGLSKKEAETKAFTDLQDITQSTQQSARPDMTSQQQAAVIGKIVLNFLNTPSQYNRIIKKAGSDIINRRITPPNTTQLQSDMSNMSRILYYGAAQNLIFYSLQTALFAVMFGLDDEDEQEKAEQFLKKKERVINGSIDTILRGSGIYGVAVSTVKNMLIKFLEQREKGYNKDESAVIMEMLNFSPVVGIKARKIVNAEKTLNYNKKIIDEMSTFDIDNPIWSAVTNYVEVAGPPANRVYQKTINLRNAMDNQYTAFQRAMFFSGYTTWSLGLGDTQKMKDIKEKVKSKKKKEKSTNTMFFNLQ